MRLCFIVKTPMSLTKEAKRSTRDQQESRIQVQTSTKPASVIYFAISTVAMEIGGAIFCSICCRYFSRIKKIRPPKMRPTFPAAGFRPDLNGARSHKQHKPSIFGPTEKHRNWQQAQTDRARICLN